ncbi:unnamed protein product [Cuscuta europaea]|uniref:Uncharacterized protein n=1 Tax=Cuscuta europaea TaxID=41803 RepID=A0A9P0YXC2_CUSEU|nr:unnamed protein product [Cuscuta europaea]
MLYCLFFIVGHGILRKARKPPSSPPRLLRSAIKMTDLAPVTLRTGDPAPAASKTGDPAPAAPRTVDPTPAAQKMPDPAPQPPPAPTTLPQLFHNRIAPHPAPSRRIVAQHHSHATTSPS